jgi:hypothetical protein
MSQNKKFILYGVERTGTNYFQGLLKKNFNNLLFFNDGKAKTLPIHKHFRLYDEQWFLPDIGYFQNFKYPDFASFDKHVSEITGETDINYLVSVKEPYSWYISFSNLARKKSRVTKLIRNGWHPYITRNINPHFIFDYNLFYKKWINFQEENPDRVMIVRYEDLLLEREDTLQKVQEHFGLEKAQEEFTNLSKVPMSRKFTDSRKNYYVNQEYFNEFTEHQLMVLTEHMDKEVVDTLGYSLYDRQKSRK